jgi:hypothetical protein
MSRIIESPEGFYCFVIDKQFGPWPTRHEAELVMRAEIRKATARDIWRPVEQRGRKPREKDTDGLTERSKEGSGETQ